MEKCTTQIWSAHFPSALSVLLLPHLSWCSFIADTNQWLTELSVNILKCIESWILLFLTKVMNSIKNIVHGDTN